MRKLYILFALCLLLSLKLSAQQKEYSGQMHITPLTLEQKGDSLYIKLTFDVLGVNVDSRKSISLIPALVSPTNRMDLPEVTVKGRANYNVYRREISLMSRRQSETYRKTAPYAVLKGFKADNNKSVSYDKVIRFEPWMADAKLDMYEDLCGCGNPPRRMGVTMLVNRVALEKIIIIEPYVITPHLAYVQPVAEAVKRREMVGEAFLDFVVNRTDIRPDYMNNPRELKKITDMIAEVQADKNISVNSISVIGYASPEGTLEGNKRLSEGRANALVGYLLPRFDYPRSLYNVKFGGENWDGLKQRVEASDMAYRQQVLNIMESVPAEINYATNTSRKKALMDLGGGELYRYMLREWYPSLRVAVCKIDYVVKGFEVADAKAVIGKRPQDLSLNEMFLVANSYEKGSQEFIDLFETAVRLYPDDVTANLNAASAALVRKDLVTAERYLGKIADKTQSPEYYNALGTLSMLKGEYEQAETYLNKAVSMGSVEAKENLDQIAKKRENTTLIEEQKTGNKR